MLVTALLSFALLTPAACQVDGLNTALKDLRAKDADQRLAAIPALIEDGGVKSGKALQKALKDMDWGVQIAAAEALSDWMTLDPTSSLVALALSTPVEQVRIAAAQALAKRNPNEVIALLAARLGKAKDTLSACATLVQLPAGEFDDLLLKNMERLFHKKEDPELRAGAASLLHLLSLQPRQDFLARALADVDLRVRIAAINAVRRAPFAEAYDPIVAQLQDPKTGDVLGRRLCLAVIAILANPSQQGAPAATVLAQDFFTYRADHPAVAWRIAVVARGVLALQDESGDENGESTPIQELARQGFLSLLADSACTDAARATAAWALGADHGGKDQTSEVLYQALAKDSSARVRRAAMVALLELAPMSTELSAALLQRLDSDQDFSIRRLAAVSLGVPDLTGVAPTLVELCADLDWQIATCAAISLGKTRDPLALSALTDLCKANDWRIRGAAVVGLTHLYKKDVIPVVIEMLADPERVVARTAHEYLQTVTYQKLPPTREAYQEWWDKHGGTMLLLTPEKARERGRAYADFGGRSLTSPYKDMDVFVFQSYGDHIENLLARREIQYTLTGPGAVGATEVHPFGVYIANCIGDCAGSDIEYLRWYVLTGGYLFSSCWALNGTIEQIEPGIMQAERRYIRGDLADRVAAEMTVAASPYLQGVFGPGSQPIYSLEGAHMVEVLLPERCEVLLDSPECAARWGVGNLAAWFPMGHGLMLDSANHFGHQGFADERSFKKPIDRQAYAVNHMGLSLEDLRVVQKEKWWKRNAKAEEFIWDESAFRFLTNFVRWKRARGH
jgi:HEAT repeat protein